MTVEKQSIGFALSSCWVVKCNFGIPYICPNYEILTKAKATQPNSSIKLDTTTPSIQYLNETKEKNHIAVHYTV